MSGFLNTTLHDYLSPPSYEQSEFQYSSVGLSSYFQVKRYGDGPNARKLLLLMQMALAVKESNTNHPRLADFKHHYEMLVADIKPSKLDKALKSELKDKHNQFSRIFCQTTAENQPLTSFEVVNRDFSKKLTSWF